MEQGRHDFREGRCATCHGGPKWTISRREFTPGVATSDALKAHDSAEQRKRHVLVQFLLAIDDLTEPEPIPPDAIICPTTGG